MSKVFQCIPNFSEGRRPEVIGAIVDAIGSASQVRVVDYSMDADHNRSVVTFLGASDDVRRAAVAGARAAVELIDLNKHEGGHPRIGAVDVIPVVPIGDATMEEAVALSREIGNDIADSLLVPVYFYEQSATAGDRTNLAVLRRGGFEALKRTGLAGDRRPDLGPATLHPTAGAVVVGARGPLIAFNVNLATSDMRPAREIAAKIRRSRESGEGMLGVKAIAVYLKSRDIAQVSTNITQPHLISIYDVYAFVEKEARAMGFDVLESELIGAMREEAAIDALRSAIRLPGLTEERILDHWM